VETKMETKKATLHRLAAACEENEKGK
jgi:hypothetical protein